MSLICNYCNKEFKQESRFLKHCCEPKRRVITQNEPISRLGFYAYDKFYTKNYSNLPKKTIEDFIVSKFYSAFIKWGKYCCDTNIINIDLYLDWLLDKQVPIDYWATDGQYTRFLIQYLPREAIDDALTRAIEYSITWENDTGQPAKDCIRHGNANKIMYSICSGRLSPWAIYQSQSGQSWLSHLREDQIKVIWDYINSDVWKKIFTDRKNDVEYAREIFQHAGW